MNLPASVSVDMCSYSGEYLSNTHIAPGKKGASVKPKKNRVANKPPYPCTIPMRVMMVPQARMQHGSQMLGRKILSGMFAKISPVAYALRDRA